MLGVDEDGRLHVAPGGALKGEIEIEGDKSVAHRALILASLAEGRSRILNMPEGDDVARTLRALQDLGVAIERTDGAVVVEGRGLRGLREPEGPIQCGESGTTARLLAGLASGFEFVTILMGLPGLRRRPMGRVAEPLRRMGARLYGAGGGERLPLCVVGGRLRAIHFDPPVPSAQVKSAVLLAGLSARGTTVVRERRPTRDHTENLLAFMGARIRRSGAATAVTGGGKLRACELLLPGDLSSAAFLIAAVGLLPGSRVTVRGVLLNEHRLAFVRLLQRAGAVVDRMQAGVGCGETMGDLTARPGALQPFRIGAREVPGLIDELPLAAVVAVRAKGRSVISGAKELRVKEADRVRTMAAGLAAMGARIREKPDGWEIHGGKPLHGAEVDARGDHRSAMALAVAALSARGETVISNPGIGKSFPRFVERMNGLIA
ncbi:MAG: 3-phosphoshikimate 1-carboxyvinyltransferase [Nitrospirae bacterium]|nr:3-phosphoshikimate 1-carboxyvinyltransferase [Nitrospirota bacterium]